MVRGCREGTLTWLQFCSYPTLSPLHQLRLGLFGLSRSSSLFYPRLNYNTPAPMYRVRLLSLACRAQAKDFAHMLSALCMFYYNTPAQCIECSSSQSMNVHAPLHFPIKDSAQRCLDLPRSFQSPVSLKYMLYTFEPIDLKGPGPKYKTRRRKKRKREEKVQQSWTNL